MGFDPNQYQLDLAQARGELASVAVPAGLDRELYLSEYLTATGNSDNLDGVNLSWADVVFDEAKHPHGFHGHFESSGSGKHIGVYAPVNTTVKQGDSHFAKQTGIRKLGTVPMNTPYGDKVATIAQMVAKHRKGQAASVGPSDTGTAGKIIRDASDEAFTSPSTVDASKMTAATMISNYTKMHGKPPTAAQIAKLRKKYA